MSWDAFEKAPENGGKYLRLKGGESAIGIFVGQPRVFYKSFKTKEERDTPGPAGSDFKWRFQINFLTKEDGKEVMKIFEQGMAVRSTLKAVKEEYGLDCVYKIVRKGSGIDDTEYSILFKEALTPERLTQIKSIPLNELKPSGSDDIDFDPANF